MDNPLYDHDLDGIAEDYAAADPAYGTVDAQECEVRLDPQAHRRHWRDILWFALIGALLMPALFFNLLAVLLGREEAGSYGGIIFMAGFLLLLASPSYADWRVLFYRCPQCDSRLNRVARSDQAAGIHEHCPDCRIIWDLGFNWSLSPDGGGN